MENDVDPLHRDNPHDIAGGPLYPTAKASGNTLASLHASNEVPDQVKSDIKETIELLHHSENPIKNIRTYQSDAADAVTHKDISLVKIAAAELEKRPRNIESDDPKKSLYVLLLSIILIVASVTALGIFFIFITRKNNTPIPRISTEQIIATDTSRAITLSADLPLQKAIEEQMTNTSTDANSVIKLIVSEGTPTKTLKGQEIATRLNTKMPTWLIRALNNEYLLGLHNTDTLQPFIIFKIGSYENAFSGMVTWEETMASDLQVFAPGASTVTSTSTELLSASKFEDIVIQNKDARVLRNRTGKPILLYSMPNKETLVITTNEATMKELFNRLITSQFVR